MWRNPKRILGEDPEATSGKNIHDIKALMDKLSEKTQGEIAGATSEGILKDTSVIASKQKNREELPKAYLVKLLIILLDK